MIGPIKEIINDWWPPLFLQPRDPFPNFTKNILERMQIISNSLDKCARYCGDCSRGLRNALLPTFFFFVVLMTSAPKKVKKKNGVQTTRGFTFYLNPF